MKKDEQSHQILSMDDICREEPAEVELDMDKGSYILW